MTAAVHRYDRGRLTQGVRALSRCFRGCECVVGALYPCFRGFRVPCSDYLRTESDLARIRCRSVACKSSKRRSSVHGSSDITRDHGGAWLLLVAQAHFENLIILRRKWHEARFVSTILTKPYYPARPSLVAQGLCTCPPARAALRACPAQRPRPRSRRRSCPRRGSSTADARPRQSCASASP